MFSLDANLPVEVYPLAWLVGRWRGEGSLGYKGIEPATIVSDVEFTSDGGPYLTYRASTYVLTASGAPPVPGAEPGGAGADDAGPEDAGADGGMADGEAPAATAQPGEAPGGAPDDGEAPADGDLKAELWHSESGYWRVSPGQTGPDGGPRLSPPFEIEALVADASGYVTVYLGEVDGPRLTLASDLVARTADAAEVTASKRLYGLVEGDLLWAWDIAAFGQPLGSYIAARLQRVEPAGMAGAGDSQ